MPSRLASRQRDVRRQGGVALLTTILIITGLIGICGLGVGIGQVLLARGQLQASADSAARTAVSIMRVDRSRLEAREVAKLVAAGTHALEDPIFITDGDVRFGDFSHQTRRFRQSGREFAPAVRVRARRSAGSAGGPINLIFANFFGPDRAEVEAHAVASIGCREIVFAIDASTGMAEEADEIKALMRGFLFRLRIFGRSGDKVGMVFFANGAVSAQDYAENGGAFWMRPLPDELSLIRNDRVDLEHWLDAMESEGDVCQDPIDGELPTLGAASCAGKGDHHGINRAMEMFDEIPNNCSSEYERMIVLITGGPPCGYLGRVVGAPRQFWVGGSLIQSYAAANAAAAAGVSIAPVLVDNNGTENCTAPPGPNGFDWQNNLISPEQFVENMKRGLTTEAMLQPNQFEFNGILDAVNQVLTVRLVE